MLCKVCMAAITMVRVEGEEELVPLDDRHESPQGEDRYRIEEWGDPPTATKLPTNYPGVGNIDHRKICQQPRAM